MQISIRRTEPTDNRPVSPRGSTNRALRPLPSRIRNAGVRRQTAWPQRAFVQPLDRRRLGCALRRMWPAPTGASALASRPVCLALSGVLPRTCHAYGIKDADGRDEPGRDDLVRTVAGFWANRPDFDARSRNRGAAEWDFWSTASWQDDASRTREGSSLRQGTLFRRGSVARRARAQGPSSEGDVAAETSRCRLFVSLACCHGRAAPSFPAISKPSRTSSRYRPCRPTWDARLQVRRSRALRGRWPQRREQS